MVELLIATNEQLLGLDASSHAYTLYQGAGIPFVVGSDDAGILRSSISGAPAALFLCSAYVPAARLCRTIGPPRAATRAVRPGARKAQAHEGAARHSRAALRLQLRHCHQVSANRKGLLPVTANCKGLLRACPSLHPAEQWVALFQRYGLTYRQAKAAARASIQHSFIKEGAAKRRLLARLDADFAAFEASLPERAEVLGVQPGGGGGSAGGAGARKRGRDSRR